MSIRLPVDGVPPFTVVGFSVSDVRDATDTIRVVVLVAPYVDEIVTDVEDATPLVEMVKAVLVEPAAIVTFAGATVDHKQYGSPGALRISNRKHGHWGYHDPIGQAGSRSLQSGDDIHAFIAGVSWSCGIPCSMLQHRFWRDLRSCDRRICAARGAGELRGSIRVTVPGVFGNAGAFMGEVTISFELMITILFVSNSRKLARTHRIVSVHCTRYTSHSKHRYRG